MASMTKIMTYIVTAETVSDLQNTRTTVPESVAEELEGTGLVFGGNSNGRKLYHL